MRNEIKLIRPIITSTYYNLVYIIGQETPVKAFKCCYHKSHRELLYKLLIIIFTVACSCIIS